MRNLNEFTITDEVLRRLENCDNPRVKEVSAALVRHLHNFVREIQPTQQEWGFAIDFLTRTGQICSDTRQEFILLSDALGVSMLVDAINHRVADGATETTVFGPFYVQNPPEYSNGDDVSGSVPGEPMYVSGSVSDIDGRPLAGAVVDIWHSDEEGFYDVQRLDAFGGKYALRARFRTDAEGKFDFWTIKPSLYPIPHDGPVGQMLEAQGRHPYRPAHVHYMISAPGHETLVTHVFERGDPYLDSDAVFGVKDSLVCDFTRHPPGPAPRGRHMGVEYRRLHYDFKLQRAPGATASI
jgi:hydroxyquinol 1,2-dioxygenase